MKRSNSLLSFIFIVILEYYVSANDPRRLQTPQKPYSYIAEDIVFFNSKANIKLAGTLTFPNSTVPRACVVLAHGSGGLDRDETIAGHKIFMVLADYLTRSNIAVLRFDERGIGESTGNFTEARDFDFAEDVLSGLKYMVKRKEFLKCKFGLIGHSKGGPTAMIAAVLSKKVQFAVFLASPAINGRKLINIQNRLLMEYAKRSTEEIDKALEQDNSLFDIIESTQDRELIKEKIRNFATNFMNLPNKGSIEVVVSYYSNPWFKDLLQFEPSTYLNKIKIPVLGLYGSKDIQVPADVNMEAMVKSLKAGGNRKFKIIRLENINHIFQTVDLNLHEKFQTVIDEYFFNEETFAPLALEIVSEWINGLNK